MAQTLYGARVYKSPTKEQNYSYGIIGKNSEAFTQGDPVTIDASNGLKVAGTTDTIIGIAAKTVTMTSDNQTVAKVCPAFIPIDQDTSFLMGTNSDLTVLTSPGVFYKLTAATTGTVQVDVSSGAQTTSNRVIVCTQVDPKGLGGTGSGSGLRQGLFKFLKIYNMRSDN